MEACAQIILLREKGYSLQEIHKRLKVSVSDRNDNFIVTTTKYNRHLSAPEIGRNTDLELSIHRLRNL